MATKMRLSDQHYPNILVGAPFMAAKKRLSEQHYPKGRTLQIQAVIVAVINQIAPYRTG